MLSFLSPTELLDQMMERLRKSLKPLIILFLCSIMSCVTLAYLIDRFLDQLDASEFVFTRSIGLLLLLLAAFVFTLIRTLATLTRKDPALTKAQERQKIETALETALAALIMSYVNEREEKRKSTSLTPTE